MAASAHFSLKCLMSRRCNRCKAVDAQPSDSYCLACSAWEGIGIELQSKWGDKGFRTLVTDILVSSARQIRGLRNLSSASSGSAGPPPSRVKQEGTEDETPSPRPALQRKRSEALKTTPKAVSKKRHQAGRETSEEAETTEDESHRKTEEDPAFGAIRDNSHRRPPEPDGPPPGHKERSHHSAKEDRHRHRERSGGGREERKHDHPWKKDKKQRKHRAGRKHQRLGRSLVDPLQPLHRKLPSSFFEVHAEDAGLESLERLQ